MALTAYLANLKDGRRIIPVPYTALDVEARRNTAEGISLDANLSDPTVRKLDLRNNAEVGKTILAVFDNDYCVGAGPIWDHDWDEDSKRLSISAEGMWSLFNRRYVLPAAAETIPLLIQAGEQAGEPNPATGTYFSRMSWPQIVRALIEQSFARVGGELPLVFEDPGTGEHDKSYEGSAFKTIGGLRTAPKSSSAPGGQPTSKESNFLCEWVTTRHACCARRPCTGSTSRPLARVCAA
jgi:hypothetical protein